MSLSKSSFSLVRLIVTLLLAGAFFLSCKESSKVIPAQILEGEFNELQAAWILGLSKERVSEILDSKKIQTRIGSDSLRYTDNSQLQGYLEQQGFVIISFYGNANPDTAFSRGVWGNEYQLYTADKQTLGSPVRLIRHITKRDDGVPIMVSGKIVTTLKNSSEPGNAKFKYTVVLPKNEVTKLSQTLAAGESISFGFYKD